MFGTVEKNMVITVEECITRLDEIEFELARLQIELTYVSQLRDLLETKSAVRGKSVLENEDATLTDKVYKVIEENPGINGPGIRDLLSNGTTAKQITTALSSLKTRKLVENRGKVGPAGRWHLTR